MNLILILFALIITVIPIIMTKMYRKFDEAYIRILIFAHWIMTLLILLGYVFGALSAANWRLSPLVCSSVILSVVFMRWLGKNTEFKRFSSIMVMFYLIICLMSAQVILKMPKDYKQDQGLYPITNFLEEHDLTYGYSTFWNANSITVISDSQVLVRSVTISNGNITPYYYQSEQNWFLPQEEQTQYFLLLSTSEYSQLKSWDKNFVDSAVEKLDYEQYIILVYNNNLF